MEHANLAEEHNANPQARVFFDFRAQRQQQRLDLAPTDRAANWTRENRR